MISRTNGEIRGYVLIGEALGFILFRISFSKLFFPVFSFIFIRISDISRIIMGCINSFYIKFEAFLLKLWQGVFKIFKSAKKLLKNALKLLYTNKNIANTEKTSNETKTKA